QARILPSVRVCQRFLEVAGSIPFAIAVADALVRACFVPTGGSAGLLVEIYQRWPLTWEVASFDVNVLIGKVRPGRRLNAFWPLAQLISLRLEIGVATNLPDVAPVHYKAA